MEAVTKETYVIFFQLVHLEGKRTRTESPCAIAPLISRMVSALNLLTRLIYLANEVRSNARATQLAAMRSMSDGLNRWVQQLVEHPNLTELEHLFA